MRGRSAEGFGAPGGSRGGSDGPLYNKVMRPVDQVGFSEWRKWATAKSTGRVLEIGAGTGLNFPYYDRRACVFAFDPDPGMIGEVDSGAQSSASINLLQASAMDLPFSSGSFDSALGTLVFCTIPDPRRALLEVKRVMKPGAPIRLVEHVRAENGIMGALMDAATPVWKRVTGGCHLNRKTFEAVCSVGFHIESFERRWFGLFIGIDARK